MSYNEWSSTVHTTGETYWQYVERTVDRLRDEEEDGGSAGVREPRSPRPSADSGGIALDIPHSDDDAPIYKAVI